MASLQGSLDFAMARGVALTDQQNADTAARDRATAEQAAAFAYHQGNPTKVASYSAPSTQRKLVA